LTNIFYIFNYRIYSNKCTCTFIFRLPSRGLRLLESSPFIRECQFIFRSHFRSRI
jgi:hypothetical protein